MAGTKRAAPGGARKVAAPASSSRQTRSSARLNAIPDIYRDMLSEAAVGPEVQSPERPLKRRRPGRVLPPRDVPATKPTAEEGEEEHDGAAEGDEDIQLEDVSLPVATIQTLYRDTDDEDEEDIEFEDVDFHIPDLNLSDREDAPNELHLDLSARASTTPGRSADRRKPMNKVEKSRRVEIHRTHLLCLLAHVARRNQWCNDKAVQKTLGKMLSEKTIRYLNPGTNLSQFGRSESLKNGLQQAAGVFRPKFDITERGLRRALWADKEEHLKNYSLADDADSTIELEEFRKAATSLKGSRDVGAQLFCALLRSVGVEARLVCSLQPLSFGGGPTMTKPESKKLTLEERLARRPVYDNSYDSPAFNAAPKHYRRPMARRDAAAAHSVAPHPAPPTPPTPIAGKKIRESPFPVYWVEVLDVAHQKWQPVDPIVTQSCWKAKVLEPPATDRENCMTYVLGFEADGTAKDVTVRYAKAYNAKTRRMRIESVVAHGERWWRKALRAYCREDEKDVDEIEKNELTATEAREPMPGNMSDFRGHPVYALERHLRRNEVLVPGASLVGTVGAGSKGPLERIYRRKDVRIARTRDKWYRLGRQVRAGEAPVKWLAKRARKKDAFGDADDDAAESAGIPVYSSDQTDLYRAPPIVNGKIIKNRFGNLDMYVPSMMPEGGVYVPDELGARAAFTLGVDYAPALTGFHFRGRHGTAVLYGVVVAAEHEEAVRAVMAGLRDQEAEAEAERRRRQVLRTWRSFLMSLRVRQRIWAGVDLDQEARQEEEARAAGKGKGLADPDPDGDGSSELSELGEEPVLEGGFLVDDADLGGGF